MKVRTSVLRGFALLALSSLTFAACDESTTPPPPPPPTVTVTPSVVTALEVGQTTTLFATVQGAANQNVTWRSGNPSVATVDAAGVVRGVAPGTTAIIAISQADTTARNAASVTVVAAPVSPVVLTLVPEQATVQVGGTVQLVGIVGGPSGVSQVVNYTSSAPTVASVSPTGLVTGLTPGTAVITARTAADPNVFRTATITVTTGPPPPQVQISITPTDATTIVGGTQRFVANITGSPNTQVIWRSETPELATIDQTGLATAVAPGNAIITAIAAADTTRRVQATLRIGAQAPPPSISIQDVFVDGVTGQIDQQGRYSGRVNVRVNVTADVSHNVRRVEVRLDGQTVCFQTFSQPLGTTQGVAVINCEINTAELGEDGLPRFLNAARVISAVAMNQANEVVAEATVPAIVLFNLNRVDVVEFTTVPVTSTGPRVSPVDGLLWQEGNVRVVVRPVMFQGGTAADLTICIVAMNPAETTTPGGVETGAATNTSSCRFVAAPGTGGTFTATFPKANAVGGTSTATALGSANLSTDDLRVAVVGTVTTAGQEGPTLSQNDPRWATNFMRLDNLRPVAGSAALTPQFPAAQVVGDRVWVGANFNFTGTTSTAAAGAGSIIRGARDPQPGSGILASGITFHVVPSAQEGQAATADTARARIVQTGQQVTSGSDLDASITLEYSLVARMTDVMGNFRYYFIGRFGADPTPPTIDLQEGSRPADYIHSDDSPLGTFIVTTTDDLSGPRFVQWRAVRWENHPDTGADQGICVTAPTTAGNAGFSTARTLAHCTFASLPVVGTGTVSAAAEVPLADAEGFYQYEMRTVDAAGNVSPVVRRDALVDRTAPTVTMTGLNANLAAQTVTVTGTMQDNLDLDFYEVRMEFDGLTGASGLPDQTLPFTAALQLGSFGLPLTESASQSGSAAIIRDIQIGVGGPVLPLGRVGFGVHDVAGHITFDGLGFTAQAGPGMPGTLTSFVTTTTEPVICRDPTVCDSPTTTQTTLRAVATVGTTDPAPFTRVLFYYQHPTTGRNVLVGIDQTAAVQTGVAQRTFTWDVILRAADIPQGATTVYAVGVTAQNHALMSTGANQLVQ